MTRQPVEFIEIDVDFCTLSYGTGACAAALGSTGTAKCFNTFKTCQDQDNFDSGTLTLRFSRPQSWLPKGKTIFPVVKSISTISTKINLAGVDSGTGALGRRGSLTVSFDDFTYSDEITDKYRAGRIDGTAQTGDAYDPKDVGTFFGRLRSRWPYFYGRAMRRRCGYVGDALEDMKTFHYVIDTISWPNAGGSCTIKAKDVLTLADNDKAVLPAVTSGKLFRDITESSLLATITPTSAADDYRSSGLIAIGSEVISYARTAAVMAFADRGVGGSEVATHSSGDAIQECYSITDALISEAAAEVLINSAGVDASLIDTAAWDAEAERWMPGLRITTIIPKSTGALTLLSELAQLGVALWQDPETQQIQFRVNRILDIGDEPAQLTDDANLINGSVDVTEMSGKRLSQVWMYHGVKDFTDAGKDPENYDKLEVNVDLQSEGPFEYDQSAIRSLYSRWVSDDSAGAVKAITQRLVARYRNSPTSITFSVDMADADATELGSFVQFSTHLLQDATGRPTLVEAQIKEREVDWMTQRVKLVAETYAFSGRYAFVAANDAPDYSDATESERRYGAWVAGNDGLMSDGTEGYKAS